MADKVMDRDYLCRPAHVLEAIERRTGMMLAKSTLKAWRKAEPLDLPCLWTDLDRWLETVMLARRQRRTQAREGIQKVRARRSSAK